MTLQTGRLVLFVLALASFSLGGLWGRYYAQIKAYLTTQMNPGEDPRWPDGFSVVRIRASADGTRQPSYFIPAPPGTARPLLVSLHSWNGTYAQHDPLAAVAGHGQTPDEGNREESRRAAQGHRQLRCRFFQEHSSRVAHIFDGGHDWSANESFDRIKEMAGASSTSRLGPLTRPRGAGVANF